MRAAIAKRLDALAAGPRPADRGAGVLVMPPIAVLDAWERRAVVQQAALAADTRAGLDDGPRVHIQTGADPEAAC